MFLLKNLSTNKKNSQYFEKESRPDVQDCEICGKSFSQFFIVKHKCKRCHRYICANCGKQKSQILGIDHRKGSPHRICDHCQNELKRQDVFILENELSWNQTSKVSDYWMSFVKKAPEKLTYKSHRELYIKGPEIYVNDSIVIERDIDEGRTDYEVWNFSLRSFLHKLQSAAKVSVIEARTNIKHVLQALIVKYPQIGYCQGMNYIIGFLLCFGNEETAFELFSDLVERVLPSRFFQKSEKGAGLLGVLAEQHVLKKLLDDAKLFENSEELEKAKEFLDLKSPQLLISLLVNILDFEGCYYIFNMLFEWGFFSQVEKAILLIAKNKLNEFVTHGNDSSRINDSITREIPISVLQKLNDIPVDETMRTISYQEYLKKFAEKWNQTDRITHRQLEKITYFSKDEIQILQQEFLFLIQDREKRHSKKKKKHLGQSNVFAETHESTVYAEQAGMTEKESLENRTSIKQDHPEVKGITKSDFAVIMSIISRKESEPLLPSELDLIFDAFDDDKSGTLDFREFLCCMSLLIKGSISDKIELCFNLFDKENKGYLRPEEGDKMIDSFGKALGLTLKEEGEITKDETKGFQERMKKRMLGKDKITMIDFISINNDPFVMKIQKFNLDKQKFKEEQKKTSEKNL